jgi:hypothetical protein
MQNNSVPLHHFAKQFNKVLTVAIVLKDPTPPQPTRGDVIPPTRHIMP